MCFDEELVKTDLTWRGTVGILLWCLGLESCCLTGSSCVINGKRGRQVQRDKQKNALLWFCEPFGIKYPWLYLYIVNEGLWTWNIYSWGRRSSWDVRLLHFCGYFRMPSVREKAKPFFFFYLSSKNVLISRQVTWKALRKLGLCLCCLSPDSAFRIKCDG